MKSMRRWSLLALLGGSIVFTGSSAQNGQQANSRSEGVAGTVEGIVRDISCPMQNKKSTATQFDVECARQCARSGSPLIILTNDGTLYVPISGSTPDVSQRERLMPLVGKRVRVTGILYERGGTHAVAVKEIQPLPEK